MSLAVLADHMASKGRGPDSMLIHMSPREVQGLQALAMKHGGSLTINPDTGLPEAGFLDKLLPAIIGFAVTAATGLPAWQVGLGVGAVETARTGDLGRGISAGLGAYGGGNLGTSFTGAGEGLIGEQAIASEAGRQAVAQNIMEGQMTEEAARSAVMKDAVANAGTFEKLGSGFEAATGKGGMQALKAASPMGAPGLGYSAAMAAGPAIMAEMSAKKNMPQTVTRPGMITPYSFDPYSGTYHAATPYRAAEGGLMGMNSGGYNPGQLDFTQKSEPVVRMAGGGVPGYAPGGFVPSDEDIFNYFKTPGLTDEKIAADMRTFNLSPADIARATGTQNQLADYEQRFAAQSIPAPVAPVAPVYEEPTYTPTFARPSSAIEPEDTYTASAYTSTPVYEEPAYTPTQQQQQQQQPVVTAPVTSAPVVTASETNKGLAALSTAPAYTSYTNEQIGKYLTDNPTADIAAAIKTTNADPTAVNAYIASLTSPFKGSTADERGSGTLGIYNQMVAQGVDPNEYYTAVTANDPKYAGWTKDMIQEGYNLDKAMYALSDAKKGVVTDTDWAKLMVGNGTWDKPQYDPNEMAQATGLSIKEVQARYELEKAKANPVITCGAGYKLSADGKSCVLDTVVATQETSCPTGYHWDKTANACVKNVDATQVTTTNVTTPTSISTADASSLPVGVSGAGITTVNPNGTITTRPDIPGIPEGGFTGMTSLRNAYTEGGGSLGYVPYTPKTLGEFDTKYGSKLTGGSKQAYDYLTGKTPYSPTPSTPTGEIMKPYAESVLGIPTVSSKKMYLFDPATKQYKINPDYAIPTRDPKTGKNTTSLTNKDVAEFVGTAPSYDALYTWMTTNNLSPEQVATASGKPFTEINKQFLKAQGLAGDDGKIDQTKLDEKTAADEKTNFDYVAYLKANPDVQAELDSGKANFGTKDDPAAAAYEHYLRYGKADGRKYTKKAKAGGLMALAGGGMAEQFNLGGYSDGGRLLRGPGDGVSDSIPATIGNKRPARLADGEFVVPARIVSELGNGSTEAGARKLYAMMDRVQAARQGSIGKGKVAKNSRADKYLPA